MSKTNKELAVDVAIAYIGSLASNAGRLNEASICSIINSVNHTLNIIDKNNN